MSVPTTTIRARSRAVSDLDLTQALFNLPAGDWENGERGIAILPGRVGVPRRRGARSRLCGSARLRAAELPRRDCARRRRSRLLEATFLDNLAFAAEAAKRRGVKLLIEPINDRDIPGFFLNRTDQALKIIARVGARNVWLQADVYHMQIMEGDLAWRLNRRCPESRISRSPTIPAETSREPERSTLVSFSGSSTGSAMTAGSAANIDPSTTTEAGLGWMGRCPDFSIHAKRFVTRV